MAIDIEALSDAHNGSPARRIRAVGNVTADDLEPYRTLLDEWVATPEGRVSLNGFAVSTDIIMRNPRGATITLPHFARWVVDNNKPIPSKITQQEALRALVDVDVRDTARYEELVKAANLESLRSDLDEWTSTPDNSFDSRTDSMISDPGIYNLSIPRFAKWYVGNKLDKVDPTEPTPAYTPWGPSHPDWNTFWDKAEKVAEAKDYCSEFDAVVREVGGRPRSTHEKVTVELKLKIDVVVEKGRTPTVNAISTEVTNLHFPSITRGDWSELSRVSARDPHENDSVPF